MTRAIAIAISCIGAMAGAQPAQELTPAPPAQATDDEVPPAYPRRDPLPVSRPVIAAVSPPVIVPLGDPDPHALPIPMTQRPLTLTEGTWRLDHAGVFRIGDGGFVVTAPNQLGAGLTDWWELGIAWPWGFDPSFYTMVRVIGIEHFDLGVRVSIAPPAVRVGDTVLHIALPVVFRIDRIVRIQTGIDIDLLLSANVSSWVIAPIQISVNLGPRVFLGAQGSIGVLDGRFATGQFLAFIGHTFAATPQRPIAEARIGGGYLISEDAALFTASLSFFPSLW
jgi:hypothetical protein